MKDVFAPMFNKRYAEGLVEGQIEGRAKGRLEGIAECIATLMRHSRMTFENAAATMEIPDDQWPEIRDMIESQNKK